MVPAGVPRDMIQLLNSEIVKGVKAADVREPLAKLAVEVHATSVDAFAEHLHSETQKWERVIREANIRVD